MGQFIDLSGMVFGRLTVDRRDTSEGPATNGRRVKWICVCSCGNRTTVTGRNLQSGNSKSCGCLQAERRGATQRTHGLTKQRVYRIWLSMKSRCKYPSHYTYRFYGAKGVKYDPRWESFDAFLSDMGHPPDDSMTLDRIDPEGHYSRQNCRWVTMQAQKNNMRKSVEWRGEKLSVAEVARRNGIPRTSLVTLLNYKGMGLEEAVAHAVSRRNPQILR